MDCVSCATPIRQDRPHTFFHHAFAECRTRTICANYNITFYLNRKSRFFMFKMRNAFLQYSVCTGMVEEHFNIGKTLGFIEQGNIESSSGNRIDSFSLGTTVTLKKGVAPMGMDHSASHGYALLQNFRPDTGKIEAQHAAW